jgi:hypothetical protein
MYGDGKVVEKLNAFFGAGLAAYEVSLLAGCKRCIVGVGA